MAKKEKIMARCELNVGDVVTAEHGKRYVVIGIGFFPGSDIDCLCIDGKINSTAMNINDDGFSICTGKKNGEKVIEKIIKVERFECAEPIRNKISCALRLGQGYGTKYELTTVWQEQVLTDDDIANMKQNIRDMEAKIAELKAILGESDCDSNEDNWNW